MSNTKGPMILRAYALYFGFIFVMGIGLFKTIKLQLTTEEVDLPVRLQDRAPRMGEILDANMNPLLTSVSYFDIHMDPTVVDQKIFDEEVSNLSNGLARMYRDKSARTYENEIRAARANGSRYLLIRKKVTNEERKRIAALPIFNLGRMKGGLIDNEETIIRKAPNGILLKRTLGYYKKELNLAVGLEGAYHAYLEGEPGKEIEHRITTGWKKTGRFTKDPVEGADVVTTFDKDIQEVAHSELEHQLKEMKAQSGTVILMEVATGHVKAMVNLDRADDGTFSEKFNHAVGLREVPGSTMKLASIMAGLEDGKFKITDKVNAGGSYQVGRKTFMDANDGRGYGTITIQQAFEKSSNIIAQILYKAYRNDPESFIERLEDFGLTSPLHTCAFYNAVANNGRFLRPLFVKEIRRGGKVIKHMEPIVIRDKICSDATLRIMQNCLKGVMSHGTGKKLTSSQFSIAGKTGTARLLNANSEYVEENQSDFQASFAGYFPADNPKYTCVVVVTRPKKQKYAALVAGPVFAAIANKIYASNLAYHPAINERKPLTEGLPSVKNGYYKNITDVLKQLGVRFQLNTGAKWITADSLNRSIHLNQVTIQKGKVPNVKGMTAKDAVFLLESVGLSVSLKGYGKVVSQSINAGTIIHKGVLVKLELK